MDSQNKIIAHSKSALNDTVKTYETMNFEEMHEYVEEDIALFDSNESIYNQSFDQHLIVQYSDMASLQTDHVILSGIDSASTMLFCYALSRAKQNMHVVFNDTDFHDINLELKDFFE